ncbi:MAG: hypothetical protein HFH84_12610 [Lachnospiraceae bacterium]|nr:hypothetical protein [Lachnospiraceae bacterium]
MQDRATPACADKNGGKFRTQEYVNEDCGNGRREEQEKQFAVNGVRDHEIS